MKSHLREGVLLYVIVFFVCPGCDEEGRDQESQIPFWESLGPASSGPVLSLGVSLAGIVFAGTQDGVLFRRLPETESWEEAASLPPEVRALSIVGENEIVAGTSSNPYFSTDNGVSWRKAAMGLPSYSSQVLSLANMPTGEVIAGTTASDETTGGVSTSTDGGASWSAQGLYRRHVYSLTVDVSGQIYAGARPEFSPIDGGVFRSTDNGLTWTHADGGMPEDTVWSLAAHVNGLLFAGTNGNGLFLSSDGGESWIHMNSLDEETVYALAVNSVGYVFVGTHGGVYRSTDNGAVWDQINLGLTDTSIRSLVVDSAGFLWAGSETSGVFRSTMSTVP